MGRLKTYILRTFSLDSRALGIFRICLGLLVLADIFMNLSTLSGLFGGDSILPPAIALRDFFEQNYWSLHVLDDWMRLQYLLFSLHIGFAVCLLLWRKTKIATIGTWILLCSLQGANPLIINSGDVLLRLLLLRGIFLPLGDTYSIDTNSLSSKKISFSYHSIVWFASVGLIFQVFFVYFFSYLMKTDPIRTHDFTATYYALSIDMFATPLGERLYHHPNLMKFITAYTLYLEGFGMLLYFVPRKQDFFKTIACFLFMTFHLWLLLTMHIGLFPIIGITAWIALLPSWFRNMISWKEMTSKIKPIIIKTGTRLSIWLISILLYITAWNVRALDFDTYHKYFPYELNKFGFLLRIDQYRAMFAPYPMRDDGRYVIAGKRADWSQVNMLIPDIPVSYTQKPSQHDIVTMFTHEKRRKLLNNLRFKKNAPYRDYYLQYLCKDRNQKHSTTQDIVSISMTYIMEMSQPDYKHDKPVRVDLSMDYPCAP